MSKLIYVDRLKKDILALQDCDNGFSDTYDKACIIGVIDEQPTIEERKWIPCSERLPEEKKEVLISAENGLYIAELEIINGREYWSEVIEYRYIENVEAWMPLPEPYAERRTDDLQ